MKTAEAVLDSGLEAATHRRTGGRLADYLIMTKPRITVMVLATVIVGAYGASRGSPDLELLTHALIGTLLVAAGSSIFNQVMERDSDRKMRRTARRPLPSGRVAPVEAAALATVVSVGGVAWLLLMVNWLAAAVALATHLLYTVVYTPLKRQTSLNTAVGAVPGAMPPMIGWAAMTGSLDPGAYALFLIIFVWQFPHFLAIAWLHRDDYARAGLRMLPTSGLGRQMIGPQVVSHSLALIPVSLLPSLTGLTGPLYFWATLVLGIQFLWYGVAFALKRNDLNARRLLMVSLVYLPIVLGMFCIDLIR